MIHVWFHCDESSICSKLATATELVVVPKLRTASMMNDETNEGCFRMSDPLRVQVSIQLKC